MARRHILIPAAIAGTALLWAVTVASSITAFGSDRLHMTLLTGSLAAVLATLHLWRKQAADAQMRVVAGELHEALRQAADELHTAINVQGETLNRDRIAAVRTLTTQLRRVRGEGRDDQVA